MRLKKKYHFHGKGSFKITVENEAMSGEVMKIQVIPRFSIGLTMYASGGRVNFPASPTLRVCVESHHQFGLTDPPCLKEMWLSFFFFFNFILGSGEEEAILKLASNPSQTPRCCRHPHPSPPCRQAASN